MPDLDLNFQFVASAQTLEAKPREILSFGENYARMIVDEVALAASKDTFQRARTRFISGVKLAIRSEVSRMAMLIGRFLPLPDKYTGPNGEMSMGELSATAHKFDFKPEFNRKQANIEWQKRSKKYLRWKRRNNLPAKWWQAHGKLQKAMMAKGASFYEETFGPIRVRLERPPVSRDERGRFSRQNKLFSSGALNPTIARAGKGEGLGDEARPVKGQVNVTAAGGRGRISSEYTVGTLHVDVFGKITPAMLPGLAHPRWAPSQADPMPGEGVVGLFPNDGPGGIRNKLLGTRKGRHYRYAVEPFVSFYLMRAIPNAVWRRTESVVSRI